MTLELITFNQVCFYSVTLVLKRLGRQSMAFHVLLPFYFVSSRLGHKGFGDEYLHLSNSESATDSVPGLGVGTVYVYLRSVRLSYRSQAGPTGKHKHGGSACSRHLGVARMQSNTPG